MFHSLAVNKLSSHPALHHPSITTTPFASQVGRILSVKDKTKNNNNQKKQSARFIQCRSTNSAFSNTPPPTLQHPKPKAPLLNQIGWILDFQTKMEVETAAACWMLSARSLPEEEEEDRGGRLGALGVSHQQRVGGTLPSSRVDSLTVIHAPATGPSPRPSLLQLLDWLLRTGLAATDWTGCYGLDCCCCCCWCCRSDAGKGPPPLSHRRPKSIASVIGTAWSQVQPRLSAVLVIAPGRRKQNPY